jgi:hypothetical protein
MRLLMVVKFLLPLAALGFAYAVRGNEVAPTETAEVGVASSKLKEERALMANIETATTAIDQRVRKWLVVRDGMFYVHENPRLDGPFSVHAMPSGTPWRASCGDVGLQLVVGSYSRLLTSTDMDERQCTQLLAVVGRTMKNLER